MTLVFGTQMSLTTFVFVGIEIVFLILMIVFRNERPVNDNQTRNIILISLLLIYNITGGLLPDPKLPGSITLQEIIAYGSGFITPCFFPYYVYKCFNLVKMKWVAYQGVLYFIFLPYILFCITYLLTDLKTAQLFLIFPLLAGTWVCYRLYKALQYKHATLFIKDAIQERVFLFLSIFPWIALPLITAFDISQTIEALTTNSGFLILLFYEIKNNVHETKESYTKLLLAEEELLNWNRKLEQEVEAKTAEIKSLLEQSKDFNDQMFKLMHEKLPAASTDVKNEDVTNQRIFSNCTKFNLTNRETEILLLLNNGLTQKAIADQLFISITTAKKHTQNLYEKIGVTSRIDMIKKITACIILIVLHSFFIAC